MTLLGFNDASKTVIRIGLIDIKHFLKGDGWRIETKSPEFSSLIGLMGATVPIKSYDNRSVLILKLLKSSPVNRDLSAMRLLDKSTGKGVFPYTITDNMNGDIFFSLSGRCESIPNPDGSDVRIWKFGLYNLISYFGGTA